MRFIYPHWGNEVEMASFIDWVFMRTYFISHHLSFWHTQLRCWARLREDKTEFINDPLGQTHSPSRSERCFRLKIVLFATFRKVETHGRTDNIWENNDHNRPCLWVGRVNQYIGKGQKRAIWSSRRNSSSCNVFPIAFFSL